jgi:hypothetical protein
MSNIQRGGFRWRASKLDPAGVSVPLMILPVASAYGTVLYRGDPVKLASTGTIQAAAPGDSIYGVFDGAEQYYDGVQIRKGGSLPVSTYGSNLTRQSKARVILARDQVFEIDADDASTFTTQATYQAAVGENAEWATGTHVGDQSGALLDISTHATTNTLSVRIIDIPNQEGQDFASIGVKLHVEFNLIQDATASATGV